MEKSQQLSELNGKERILEASAKLFGELGYEKTSIRRISKESGMKAGSIYYFFRSKEEILLEVYARGFELMSDIVLNSLNKISDPWDRLYQACNAHLQGIFEHRTFIEVTVRELPDRHSEPTKTEMKKLRQRYETIFIDVIEEIPLRPEVDRSYFRLMLLGSMAWTLVWYDPDGAYSPKQTAKEMVDLFRYSCGA